MKRAFAMALFLFASGVAVGACSGKPPTAAQVAAEGAYGGALLQCVDQAKTLAESKACRAKVDAQYGVASTGRDGGQ